MLLFFDGVGFGWFVFLLGLGFSRPDFLIKKQYNNNQEPNGFFYCKKIIDKECVQW